jgi:hypothetical protein
MRRRPCPRVTTAVGAGGLVVIEGANFAGCFTYPRCPAYDSWVAWYQETVRRNGGDTELGLRVPSILRAAGLTNVGVRVTQPAYLDGPHKQLQQMSMAKMKAAVIAAGVASADECQRLNALTIEALEAACPSLGSPSISSAVASSE